VQHVLTLLKQYVSPPDFSKTCQKAAHDAYKNEKYSTLHYIIERQSSMAILRDLNKLTEMAALNALHNTLHLQYCKRDLLNLKPCNFCGNFYAYYLE
jgi:hypothetical protein